MRTKELRTVVSDDFETITCFSAPVSAHEPAIARLWYHGLSMDPWPTNARGGRPRASPESVAPGGIQTHALGQTSVSEVNDQTSSNPTVSRGSLAPPRHPRRGRGSGLVNVLMNNGILGLIRAHPCMGGGPRPSPAGRGSTDDGPQRLKLAHPYMGGGPRPSPAGRGSNLGGSIVEKCSIG